MSTESVVNWSGRDVFKKHLPAVVCHQYIELAKRLYPDERHIISLEQFLQLMSMPHQLLVFRVQDDDLMVSTAQATLVHVYPKLQVLVSNVITREGYEDCGHALAVMETLITEARQRWGKVQFVLTNNKKKGNSEFYTKHGWVEGNTTVYTYTED